MTSFVAIRKLAALGLIAYVAYVCQSTRSDSTTKSSTLEVERLVLRDGHGRIVGTLGANATNAGTGLLLFDKQGINRAGFYTLDSLGAFVDLRDAKGDGKLRLGVQDNGVAAINLLGTNVGDPTVTIQLGPDGSSMIAVGNTKCKSHVRILSQANGDVALAMRDKSNVEVLNLFATFGGESGVTLFDPHGKPAVTIRADEKRGRGLVVHDPQGNARDGVLLDREGRPAARPKAAGGQ